LSHLPKVFSIYYPLDKDRVLSKDIETMMHLMRSGKIIEEVERVVGTLR